MPDWNLTRPSGLMMNRPSKPIEPPEYGLTATPMPRALLPLLLAAVATPSSLPLEQLAALVERFLDERAGHVGLLAVGQRRTERRVAGRRVDLAELHLIDAELLARPWR